MSEGQQAEPDTDDLGLPHEPSEECIRCESDDADPECGLVTMYDDRGFAGVCASGNLCPECWETMLNALAGGGAEPVDVVDGGDGNDD